MQRSKHLLIMGVWALALCVVAVALRGRLFPPPPMTASALDLRQAPELPQPGQPPAPALAGQDAIIAAHQALKAANPAYNGRGLFRMDKGQVVIAVLVGTGLSDPSPLRAMPLEALDLSENPLTDLTGLRDLPLERLALEATGVTDLSPLGGMKLNELYLNHTEVSDLRPLANVPLVTLNLSGTNVQDVSAISDMPMRFLWLNDTPVADISPIAGCPLVSLTLHRTNVADISSLAGSELQRLHIGETPVTDLTPLADVPLHRLIFTPSRISRGMDVVRNMATIREIGASFEGRMPPEQFWALYDQGQIN